VRQRSVDLCRFPLLETRRGTVAPALRTTNVACGCACTCWLASSSKTNEQGTKERTERRKATRNNPPAAACSAKEEETNNNTFVASKLSQKTSINLCSPPLAARANYPLAKFAQQGRARRAKQSEPEARSIPRSFACCQRRSCVCRVRCLGYRSGYFRRERP